MQTNEYADHHGDPAEPGARLRGPFESVDDVDASAVLDALTDPLCRQVLACANDPVTARDVAETADLSMSTTYRKLDALTDAGLLETQTELREDGYHTTRYRATVEEATVRIGDDNDLHVSVQRATTDD
ncbi:MAG: helix-turn-helix domain-containing protein [Halobacterium sp.]